MRRLPLVLFCAFALLAGVSYLPSSSPAAGSAENDSFQDGVGRGMEAREGLTAKLREGADDVKYGLERAKRELQDLIP